MGFSRHEYWRGLLFPAPGDLPDPGIGPVSPTLQADALPMNSSISPLIMLVFTNIFTNVFTNINKVLFVTLWNLFLSDLKKWKFEAYSLSGCPGTKKECFCIIAEASHFLGRGLFQLEESRDLHHHSASFSSYFLVQASSVSSFQIRRGIQVSSGFTSSSHTHCSRSGSWRACAAWFGSVLGSGDPAAFFWGSVPPRNLLPFSVPVWSSIQHVRTPQPCLNPRILCLLLGSVEHCCCCSEKSRFVFGKGLLTCHPAEYVHVEQRVGLRLPEGTNSPRTSSKTTTDSELRFLDWSNLFIAGSLFLCL